MTSRRPLLACVLTAAALVPLAGTAAAQPDLVRLLNVGQHGVLALDGDRAVSTHEPSDRDEWRVVRDGETARILNVATRRCLEPRDAGDPDGSAVVARKCDRSPEQRWIVEPHGALEAFVFRYAKDPELVVTVEDGDRRGSAVVLEHEGEEPLRLWHPVG
jgi:Ricin-type beta-trefoil lectin domain-like